jgi:hypothetical protein
LFWGVVSALLLCGAAGCTPEQLGQLDRAAGEVNAVGDAVTQISHGPAAGIIPPDVLAIMEIAGLGLAAAYAVWQRIRASGLLQKNQDLAVTIKAIADGIDASGDKAADDVKAHVLAVMMQRRIYDRADRVVDSVRTKKGATA